MIAKSKEPKQQKVRCAIYTRKSSDAGLDLEFNSLDAQREAAEAFIVSQRSEGWVCLPERYDDGGFSGGNTDRPALQRLIADIQAGRIDVVAVYKIDRLSRSLLDFLKMVETFEQHGASFIAVTQQMNTSTPMGRLMLNVLLSFGQFEREIIGERIRDKIAAQRRKGKWAGGIPILGYDVDRSGPSPKLVINSTEAAQVRELFRLYVHHGALLPAVQEAERRRWTNKAWRTKKEAERGGRPFDKSALHALLTNPLYVGRIKHKHEVYAGEHEAIISEEIFTEVQRRLQKNGRDGGCEVRNRHGALLRGLLHCKACGRQMTHTFTSKGQRRYRYYKCTRAIQNGVRSCPSRSLSAPEVEQIVVDEIRGIAHDPALRAEVVRQAQSLATGELATTRREQGDVNRELGRIHAEIRKLAASKGTKRTERIAELHERVAFLETRMAQLKAQITEMDSQRIDAADVDAVLDDFETVWDALSPREQARLLSLLVAKIEFDADDESINVTFQPTGLWTLAEGQVA